MYDVGSPFRSEESDGRLIGLDVATLCSELDAMRAAMAEDVPSLAIDCKCPDVFEIGENNSDAPLSPNAFAILEGEVEEAVYFLRCGPARSSA